MAMRLRWLVFIPCTVLPCWLPTLPCGDYGRPCGPLPPALLPHCCQRPPIARQAYWLACSLAAGGLLKFRTVGRREYSHLLRLSEWRGRPGGQAEHRVHVPGCGMCRPSALRSDCCLSRLPHAATVHTSQAIPATPMCCRRCADQLHACARGAGRFHLREPAFLCGGELATAAATGAALCCVVLCTCACLELCSTLL